MRETLWKELCVCDHKTENQHNFNLQSIRSAASINVNFQKLPSFFAWIKQTQSAINTSPDGGGVEMRINRLLKTSAVKNMKIFCTCIKRHLMVSVDEY